MLASGTRLGVSAASRETLAVEGARPDLEIDDAAMGFVKELDSRLDDRFRPLGVSAKTLR